VSISFISEENTLLDLLPKLLLSTLLRTWERLSDRLDLVAVTLSWVTTIG